MRRLALSSMLALAMSLGFVNLDLSQLTTNPAETVSFGTQDAEARRGGGSSFRSSPRRSAPSRPRTTPSKPRPPKAAPARPAPKAAKPAPKTGDAATKAAKRSQSARKMQTAKPAITSKSGVPIRVAGTPAAKSVRGMSPAMHSSRSSRQESRFSSIPRSERTVVINRYGGGMLGDPFSGLFMYSLLSMSLHNQAMFHHHHWNNYSALRQSHLLAENAALKAELSGLEATPRDPNYVPAGTDPDLLYSDEFVEAAYNPAPVEKDLGWGLGTWILVFSITGMGFFGAYWVFLRRTPEEA